MLSFPLCAYVRFDLEQNQAQAEVQRERSLREKLAREKDTMAAEIFNIRQQLQVCTAEDILRTVCPFYVYVTLGSSWTTGKGC